MIKQEKSHQKVKSEILIKKNEGKRKWKQVEKYNRKTMNGRRQDKSKHEIKRKIQHQNETVEKF